MLGLVTLLTPPLVCCRPRRSPGAPPVAPEAMCTSSQSCQAWPSVCSVYCWPACAGRAGQDNSGGPEEGLKSERPGGLKGKEVYG